MQAKPTLTPDPPASPSQQLGLQVYSTVHAQLAPQLLQASHMGVTSLCSTCSRYFLLFFFSGIFNFLERLPLIFFFPSELLIFILCMGGLPPCLCGACRGQKRALEPLELKPRSSGRADSGLNCWAISPSLVLSFWDTVLVCSTGCTLSWTPVEPPASASYCRADRALWPNCRLVLLCSKDLLVYM